MRNLKDSQLCNNFTLRVHKIETLFQTLHHDFKGLTRCHINRSSPLAQKEINTEVLFSKIIPS